MLIFFPFEQVPDEHCFQQCATTPRNPVSSASDIEVASFDGERSTHSAAAASDAFVAIDTNCVVHRAPLTGIAAIVEHAQQSVRFILPLCIFEP